MNSKIGRIRPARFAVVAVAAALLLAACGGGGDDEGSSGADSVASPSVSASASASAGGSASASAHNAQDVAFAQGMIPHHRQAVEMAALAADRASSAQVTSLSGRIQKAQDPEIETMSGWLKGWGEEVPAEGGTDHSGHSGMAGMMDEADMDKLEKASGAEFDSLFMEMMIEHHEGAIEMAKTEKAKGSYAPALALSDAIVTAQQAEIAEMKGYLAKK
ncbi:DUF305 domain-containing protein [Streptomyces roseirectus]|uniref:DUF305 domain-containing protein n=1 Tax=Streptomyces roseirectus TaxID=2768066 RepID=A0A7H0IJJ3_9ACTN|nr:DUF305 domain-containing protein [Streptomyces roseirectus]QNP72959.1 DUF305 domain-containing protein [Streptomyces roseirectus]